MTEQFVMNDFIKKNIGIKVDEVNLMSSKYINSSPEVQNIYEDAAFEIFNFAYQKDSAENDRIKNLPFHDYVKIYNPSKEYQTYLRQPGASRESPAWFFQDVFNGDMGGLRLAALDSYKRRIEEGGQQEPV